MTLCVIVKALSLYSKRQYPTDFGVILPFSINTISIGSLFTELGGLLVDFKKENAHKMQTNKCN